jgi:hypothetical protein
VAGLGWQASVLRWIAINSFAINVISQKEGKSNAFNDFPSTAKFPAKMKTFFATMG